MNDFPQFADDLDEVWTLSIPLEFLGLASPLEFNICNAIFS